VLFEILQEQPITAIEGEELARSEERMWKKLKEDFGLFIATAELTGKSGLQN
jgi:hypothetical protein